MRPQYLLQKDGEQKTVKSNELSQHQKDGWAVLETIRGGVSTPAPIVIEKPKQDVIDPQFKPEKEIKTETVQEIETPTIKEKKKETPKKKTDEVSSAIPSDLKCPYCGAKARTKASYIKNHDQNCHRRLK